MDVNVRARATRVAQRVDSSLLATDRERNEALSLANQIHESTSRLQALELVVQLEDLARQVMSRESGQVALSDGDREELQEGLAVLEGRLVDEISARKRAQRFDVLFFLALLCMLIVATAAGAGYLLLSGPEDTRRLCGQALALAVGVSAVLIVARLFQNAREALERLDEKVVAVRFLRMALHPSWTSELGGRLIAPALAMFAQHFAPTSATLGVDDTRPLLDPFAFLRPGSAVGGSKRGGEPTADRTAGDGG